MVRGGLCTRREKHEDGNSHKQLIECRAESEATLLPENHISDLDDRMKSYLANIRALLQTFPHQLCLNT